MANDYQEFNNFQTAFYTNIDNFDKFSKFEVKRHGYVLLNNLAKGFPNLADLVLNLHGINWSGPESPAILKALQRKFINNFSSVRIPGFIYYKSETKPEKEKTKKTEKGLLIFDSEIKKEICSILKYDTKTYEYLKFSDEIQLLGQQLLGQTIQQEKLKTTRKKKV